MMLGNILGGRLSQASRSRQRRCEMMSSWCPIRTTPSPARPRGGGVPGLNGSVAVGSAMPASPNVDCPASRGDGLSSNRCLSRTSLHSTCNASYRWFSGPLLSEEDNGQRILMDELKAIIEPQQRGQRG